MISVTHFYHSVAVLLFKLPVGNKKHPSWRGEKGVWIFLCSEVTPLEDHISTILLQIVVTLPWVLKVFLLLLAADKWEDNWLPGYSCYPYCTSKKKKNQSLKFCIFFQPGDCCWWVYLALSSGEISHLQTESWRKELPCVLQALLRCSSTAKIKTRDHKGWGFSGKLTIYRLFAEVTVFTSLLFSNTIFY